MRTIETQSTAVVLAERQCPRCGASIGGFGPEGLCGACLFDSGLAADETAAESDLLASGSRRFGDYELLEEIARGGMGVIFKARQISLNRIVAVKMILRGEFAGVTELSRFRAEAETAARLQHPNIVAIHEVGEHEGQPYFSMDYVAGQNLAQLVGNTPLPVIRAATYLKTIAEAVHYAHQHGVLHRDLKPSNVLIDANDQPRVTDFGLAKRLGGDASLTVTGQVLGSPNFMPPEQAAGKHDAIGSASDVYSLGALLYHLLTGRPPFVADSVPATLRLVEESEPAPPRLLVPTVPRDLETICLKCLQKEPQGRYVSAQELAEELDRFLRDEPIRARPIGPTARFWRWCRRNRALAATGAAVALLVLAVAIGSPIAAFRINRERQQARQEAAKSQQVAQFLKDMLMGVGPSVALGRDTKMLRDILDKTAERIGKDLTNQPAIAAELRNTIGEVYQALGKSREAEAMYLQALATRKELFGNEHLDVAVSLNDLAGVFSAQLKWVEAETVAREALAIRRHLLGDEHQDIATSLDSLGSALEHQGRLAEAETVVREGLAMRRKLLGQAHPDVSASLDTLAWILKRQGKLAEAEPLAREGLEMQRILVGNEHPDVADRLDSLAFILQDQGKLPEAEIFQREAAALQRKLLGSGHPELENALINLAVTLFREGKLSEAKSTYQDMLSMRQKPALELAESANASVLNKAAWLLATAGDGAFRDGARAVQLAEKAALLTNRKDTLILDTLAAAYAEVGQFEKAISVQREAIGLLRDKVVKLNYTDRVAHYQAKRPYRATLRCDVAASLDRTVTYLLATGRFAEAEKPARECLVIREDERPEEWETFVCRGQLGSSLLGQKKYAEAEPLLLSGYAGLKQRDDAILSRGKTLLEKTLQRLVQLYEATSRPELAAEWRKKLVEFDQVEAGKKAAAPQP